MGRQKLLPWFALVGPECPGNSNCGKRRTRSSCLLENLWPLAISSLSGSALGLPLRVASRKGSRRANPLPGRPQFGHLNFLRQPCPPAPREAQTGDRERQRRSKSFERASDGYMFVIGVSESKTCRRQGSSHLTGKASGLKGKTASWGLSLLRGPSGFPHRRSVF